MALSDEDREALEDAIFEVHHSASKYLNTQKEVHRKLLEINVTETLELLEILSEDLYDDEKNDNYKLHLLFPLQLVKFLQINDREQPSNDNEQEF